MIRICESSSAASCSRRALSSSRRRGEVTRRNCRGLNVRVSKTTGQRAERGRGTCRAWRSAPFSIVTTQLQSSGAQARNQHRRDKHKAESTTGFVEQNVQEEEWEKDVGGNETTTTTTTSSSSSSSGMAKQEETARGTSGRQLLTQTLKSTLGSNIGGIVLVGMILVLVTGVILSQPLLSGQFLQSLMSADAPGVAQRLRKILLAMSVAYMLEPICTFVYVTTMSKVAQKFVLDLQQKLFATILAQSTAFFDLNSTTSLMGIISSEVNSIGDVIAGNLSRDRGFRAIFEATGGVIVLCAIAPRLAPVLLAFIMLTSINAALFSRKTKGLFFQKEMFKVEMDAAASTAFANIKTVRAFAAERYEFSNFLGMLNKSDHLAFKLGRSKASLESLARFAIYSSLLALYFLGGHLVTSRTMPVSTFMASIGYTFSLVFATQGITNTFADVSKAVSSLKKIEAFLDGLEPISATNEREMMNNLKLQSESCDDIECDEDLLKEQQSAKVSLRLKVDKFSYPTRENTVALRNIDLELESGKVIALVGPSGAGKSSIVQLLSRFYKLESGHLQYNGIDQSQFSRREWANIISLVGQEPVLFPTTIQSNIAYGLEDASMSQIEAAAKAANAHSFISSLPDGYMTQVGERGGQLSGGQKQRIAIARAFIRDSPVLLLDEATSALDAESEKLVQDALEKLFSNKAVLIIAHRLSTVVNADEIIVVEEGEIIDRGKHQELLSRNSLYQKLIGAQQLQTL